MDDVEIPFVVEPGDAGMRLDRYLCRRLRGMSRTRVQHLIASALIADEPLKPATIVRAGLSFRLRRKRLAEPETPRELPELHCDDDLLVLNKPAGLPVHPSARYELGTVVGRLRTRYGPDFAVPAHRLDRETSGVLVCTRHEAATRSVIRAFQHGDVEKTYLAVCAGWPDDEFLIDAPIALGGRLVRIAVRIDPAGRASQTSFRVMRRFTRDGARFALVQAHPRTGRQHQIRVHLQHAGHPIVGDKLYGLSEEYYDRFTRSALSATDWARLRLPRQALHAESIRFQHPTGRRDICVTAPLPADLVAFLAV